MHIVTLNETKLVGLALKSKTTNTNGQSSIDCEKLWHTFHQEKYAEQIQGKLSEEIYGVYYDYEGDYTQPFSYFVGYKVSTNAAVPGGLTSLTIPAGRYQKFVAKGIMPACITNVWKEIWRESYPRSYQVDFEVYDERSKDWNNAEVDVFLSLKTEQPV